MINKNLTNKESMILRTLVKTVQGSMTLNTLKNVFHNEKPLSVVGVVGSLVKKGLVEMIKMDEDTYVVLTEVTNGTESDSCCNNSHCHEVESREDMLQEFIAVNVEICDLLTKVKYVLGSAEGLDREYMIQTTKEIIEEAKSSKKVTEEDLELSYEILYGLQVQYVEEGGEECSDCHHCECEEETEESVNNNCNQVEATTHDNLVVLNVSLTENEVSQLKELAHRLSTQDNRGTRLPILFLLQDVKRELTIDASEGEVVGYYDSEDCEEYIAEDVDTLVTLVLQEKELDNLSISKHLEELEKSLDLDIEALEVVGESREELEQEADDLEFEVRNKAVGYKYVYETQRVFLTEQAAKDHLEQNDYHYTDRVRIYVDYAWRNPELELVTKVLSAIK